MTTKPLLDQLLNTHDPVSTHSSGMRGKSKMMSHPGAKQSKLGLHSNHVAVHREDASSMSCRNMSACI